MRRVLQAVERTYTESGVTRTYVDITPSPRWARFAIDHGLPWRLPNRVAVAWDRWLVARGWRFDEVVYVDVDGYVGDPSLRDVLR